MSLSEKIRTATAEQVPPPAGYADEVARLEAENERLREAAIFLTDEERRETVLALEYAHQASSGLEEHGGPGEAPAALTSALAKVEKEIE